MGRSAVKPDQPAKGFPDCDDQTEFRNFNTRRKYKDTDWGYISYEHVTAKSGNNFATFAEKSILRVKTLVFIRKKSYDIT